MGTLSWDKYTEQVVVVEGGAGDLDPDLTHDFNAVSTTSVGLGLFWHCCLLGCMVLAPTSLLLCLPMVLTPALLLLHFCWFLLVGALAASLSSCRHIPSGQLDNRRGWVIYTVSNKTIPQKVKFYL